MAENQLSKIDPKGPPSTLANLKSFIQSPAMMQSLKDVCTSILTPDQVAKQLFLAASRQPKLLECTLPSLCKGIATSGQLGLDCSGTLGSGYLVPYFNSKTQKTEAQFIPGYRGLVDLARRSGSILDIQAHVVYEDDEWLYRLGTDPVLNHVPNFDGKREDKNIVGAYAVAWLKDARPHPEFMSIGDIKAIMSRSNAKESGPWVTDFAEMCKKTVVRRIVKLLPLSVEVARQIAVAEEEEIDLEPARTSRREVASVNIEEVLGNATEQTTVPGGTAATAPQPKAKAKAPAEDDQAPDPAPASAPAATQQPEPTSGPAVDPTAKLMGEIRNAWANRLKTLKGWDEADADVVEDQIGNFCMNHWAHMSLADVAAKKPSWLKNLLAYITGDKIPHERFDFGISEASAADAPKTDAAPEKPNRPVRKAS